MSAVATEGKLIRSTIPARPDRLRWSPFHTRMVAGLGAAWILDGLQITISSSVVGVLTKPSTLGMSSTEIGLIAIEPHTALHRLPCRRRDHDGGRRRRDLPRDQRRGQVARGGNETAHRNRGAARDAAGRGAGVRRTAWTLTT